MVSLVHSSVVENIARTREYARARIRFSARENSPQENIRTGADRSRESPIGDPSLDFPRDKKMPAVIKEWKNISVRRRASNYKSRQERRGLVATASRAALISASDFNAATSLTSRYQSHRLHRSRARARERGDVHEWKSRRGISRRDESRIMKHRRRARRCLRKVRSRLRRCAERRGQGRGVGEGRRRCRLDNNRDIMTASRRTTMFIGDLSHLHAATRVRARPLKSPTPADRYI